MPHGRMVGSEVAGTSALKAADGFLDLVTMVQGNPEITKELHRNLSP